MKLPAGVETFFRTMARAKGKTLPPVFGSLFDAEWSEPTKATGVDFHIGDRASYSHDVASGKILGSLPDGSRVTLLFQIDGLREVPEPLREYLGGGGANGLENR
jgi:hypothetical protein